MADLTYVTDNHMRIHVHFNDAHPSTNWGTVTLWNGKTYTLTVPELVAALNMAIKLKKEDAKHVAV